MTSARDRWSWTDNAACADPSVDPDIFFPSEGDTATQAKARAICLGCAVKDTCFSYPFRDDRGHRSKEAGVWGAATPENRDATKRELINRARRKAGPKTEG